LSDPIAPHSGEAVAALRALGLDVRLLSGDHEETARRVAREVGVASARGGLSPAEKTAIVQQLRAEGRVVAMVGDGINDAPALATADLGIAIGAGADIAAEAAAIVLVGRDLNGAPRTIRLARKTLAIIRQNLAWALAYNVVLIPVAAGALAPWGISLHPAAAAAAMAASSVSVVANSLRLRRVAID
jgi:P-type E1-E2 ATPase